MHVYELKDSKFTYISLVFIILDHICAKCEKKTLSVRYQLALL